MREPVAGMNPKILVWARQRTGQSISQVAQALNKEPEVIESWEAGDSAPTYAQLETLAYRVFKRPVALFFFPEPPDEPDPEHSFRTLPELEIDDLLPDTRYRIRDARAMQLALYELNGGNNPTPRKIFRDLGAQPSKPAAIAASELRSYLGIDIRTQRLEWKNAEEALRFWRDAIEEVGIFVFKHSLKQRDVSGFCLYDDEFPIIYLNNSTVVVRQIFTLLHELAHILLRTSGVTKVDDRYIGSLRGEARRVEVFCNQFAADFLVPEADFRKRVRDATPDDETVAELAREYKVSREVVLRRLLSLHLVSKEYYESKVSQWYEDFERRHRDEGGGNYYATQATYLGERFLGLVFANYYQGRISVQQLADFLNIRVSSVPGLEERFLRKIAI
jgi:Zn-dependent peptidase ImmA (M78 family)